MRAGLLPVMVAVLFGTVVVLSWQQRASCNCSSTSSSQEDSIPYLTHRLALIHRQRQQQQQINGASVPLGVPNENPGLAAAAPAGSLDMAHMLLPLTNLSALSTAELLEAHPGLSSMEARELVRQHQELYCK